MKNANINPREIVIFSNTRKCMYTRKYLRLQYILQMLTNFSVRTINLNERKDMGKIRSVNEVYVSLSQSFLVMFITNIANSYIYHIVFPENVNSNSTIPVVV